MELSCQLYPFMEEKAEAQWSQQRTRGLRVIQWQSQGLGLVHKLQPACWPMDRVTHQPGFLGIGAFLECRCFSAKFSNACMLSRFSQIWLCVTSRTVAQQAPLSLGFPRQEYWSGLSCPPPRDLSYPGIKPTFLRYPALAGRFYTTSTTWKSPKFSRVPGKWG